MSVYLISNTVSEMTDDVFYEMILRNEANYNADQRLGLSYQLMKTEVRKQSEDYAESYLVPEFMGGPYDDAKIKEIMHTNIRGLDELDMTTNTLISSIHSDLFKNLDKLRTLVVSSGNETQTSLEMEQNIESGKTVETNKNINYDKFDYADNDNFVRTYGIVKYGFINIHTDCDGCKIDNGTRFFDTMYDEYKLNGKPIYISYNLLYYNDRCLYEKKYKKYSRELIKSNCRIPVIPLCDRISFVEFKNYVLIENEFVALHIYALSIPVYDYNGFPVNPLFTDKLTIDPVFGSLIGLKGSGKNIISDDILDSAAKDITIRAQILLKFNIIVSTVARFNLSNQLAGVLLDLNKKINDVRKQVGYDMVPTAEDFTLHKDINLTLPLPAADVVIGTKMEYNMKLRVSRQSTDRIYRGGGENTYDINKKMYMKLRNI